MIVNVQFLRFAAALAVVLFHARPYLCRIGHLSWLGKAADSVGLAGVDVFFVISGFIMWHTTQGARGRSVAVPFLQRRLARIYTGYWPYLVLAVLLLYFFSRPDLAGKDILSSIFLYPCNVSTLVLPVSWTLTYELYFYLLFFLLLFGSPQTGLRFVVTIGVVLLSANVIGTVWFGLYAPGISQHLSAWFKLLISPFLLEFLAGCLICRAYLSGANLRPRWSLAAGIVLIASAGWYNTAVLGGAMEHWAHLPVRICLFGGGAALMVMAATGFERSGWVAPARLSRMAGGSSYSLYLSHTLWIALFSWLGFGRLQGWLMVAAVWGLLGMIMLYSVVHYIMVEKPLYGLVARRIVSPSAR